MPEWLFAALDSTRVHDVPAALAWHARAMTLAWGILAPCGIVAARFLKLWPGQNWPERLDHPGWWHIHRACQYGAGGLSVVGLALILSRPGWSGLATVHGLLGWSVVALAALQFVSAWLRGSKGGPTAPNPDGSWRGDHYDMTARRIAFEYVHKFFGYFAVLLAAAAIASGLWHANAPVWMALAIGLWWALCLAVFLHLQWRGRAFDTYQAHWGADPVHPGNRRPPIGFGIRRHAPSTCLVRRQE